MKFENKAKKAGKVLKSHGKQGEILISTDFNLPDNITKLESIFIAIDEQLVPFFIENILPKSSKTAAVKLEDIDNAELANELISNEWFIPEEYLYLFIEKEDTDPEILIGFTLIDQDNHTMGEIKSIQHIPSNTLLEVDIEGVLYDIPFNENTIISIDPEKKIVKNQIPEGLLDL
jgi:16S rRNA processing protein RimM